MTMTLDALNRLPLAGAVQELARCCGSTRWVHAVAAARPFRDERELFDRADAEWSRLGPEDWLEAFSHHPRIGQKSGGTAWSRQEQAGAASAGEETLRQLAELNAEYERRFGFIYLVCATGKSADEMLRILKDRLTHERDAELRIAAGEQAKITRIRLEKLLAG